MQDRVSQNPGRMLVTPENGTAPFYATLTLADNPTTTGTALNKASLLTDATAALYDGSAIRTTKGVSIAIPAVNLGNAGTAAYVIGSYTGTGLVGSFRTIALSFTPRAVLLMTSTGLTVYVSGSNQSKYGWPFLRRSPTI